MHHKLLFQKGQQLVVKVILHTKPGSRGRVTGSPKLIHVDNNIKIVVWTNVNKCFISMTKTTASCFLLGLIGVSHYLVWVGFYSLKPSGWLADHSSELLHLLLAGFWLALLGLHKPHPFWAASPSHGWGSWRHGCRALRCRWAGAGRRPGTPYEFWHQDGKKKKTTVLLPFVLHFLFPCGWPEPCVTKQHRLQESPHPSEEVDRSRPVWRFAPHL